MYTTLKEARKHLQLDDFFHEDDEYIVSLIRAAEDATEKRLGCTLASILDPKTGELPGSIKESILLLTGSFYNQREATTPQTIRETPLAFEFLTDLYRKPGLA